MVCLFVCSCVRFWVRSNMPAGYSITLRLRRPSKEEKSCCLSRPSDSRQTSSFWVIVWFILGQPNSCSCKYIYYMYFNICFDSLLLCYLSCFFTHRSDRHWGPAAGRCARNHSCPAEGWPADMGADGWQTRDSRKYCVRLQAAGPWGGDPDTECWFSGERQKHVFNKHKDLLQWEKKYFNDSHGSDVAL